MSGIAAVLKPVLEWAYGKRGSFPLVADIAIWPMALLGGAALKLVFSTGSTGSELIVIAVVAMALQAILGTALGVYRRRWRVGSFDESMAIGAIWAVITFVIVLGNYAFRLNGSTDLPTTGVSIGALSALVGLGAIRAFWRHYWEETRRPQAEGATRTIVFGAGEGGAQMVHAMMLDPQSEYLPVALVDDDPRKQNRELDGVRVQGTRENIAMIAMEQNAETLLVAVPTANAALIKDLAARAREASLDLRVLPSSSDLVGRMTLADVRPPTVDDLLGRDPVEIDLDSVADYVRGKRVLITGAGGSIGSELSRQVKGFGPSELYLLDRDESALHGVQLSMEGRALLDTDMLVVANIRDRERMFELFERCKPEVVFHTAALKHLTLLENHPEEGMKTNTIGTKNLLDAAKSVGVERFVNISTDKAADPTSVLGATKLAAERLTAKMAEDTGLPYVSVRFGNVLGSRGSVLPTFMGQIEQGKPITVTHPDVTRYFMTIPEAVRLVVQAGAIGGPGEVLILDMGEPVKIVDLAIQLIDMLSPSTKIEYTGLRPGEKMHEILISKTENGDAKIHPRISHTMGDPSSPSAAMEACGPAAEAKVAQMLGKLPSDA